MMDMISPAVPRVAGFPELADAAAGQGAGIDALLAEHYLAAWREGRQRDAQRQAGLRQEAAEVLARRRLDDRRLEEQAQYVRTQQEVLRARPNYNDAEQLRDQVDRLARAL